MADEKFQVSQTRLQMFQRCGEQYRRRYVEGERMPPGVSLIVGSAVDRSVNANLQEKIDTGSLKPLAEVRDIARDETARGWLFGVALSDDEVTKGVKLVRGESIDKSVRLSGMHAEKVAPKLQPTHVQRGLAVELERLGEPVSLVTIIDVQEGRKSIRDTKTTGKRPEANAAHKSLQLTIESLAVKVHDGEAPERLFLDYLVDTKSGGPDIRETARGVGDYAALLPRIDALLHAHRTGSFAPTNPDNWWCSERFCGFATTCRYFRRPETVALEAGAFDLLDALKKSVKAAEE